MNARQGNSFQGAPRSDDRPLVWGKHPRSCGRTHVSLQCPCGLLMNVNVWSWAGVGWKGCPECGRKIAYKTLIICEEARSERSCAQGR